MNHFSRKGRALVFIALLVALFILGALFPSAGPGLGMVFLVLSLLLTSYFIVRRQREACRRGEISRLVFLRNVAVEVTGAGGAMVLAGLLGRTLAGLAVAQIGDELLRFLLGAGVGLLAGLAVGMLVSRIFEGLLVKSGG